MTPRASANLANLRRRLAAGLLSSVAILALPTVHAAASASAMQAVIVRGDPGCMSTIASEVRSFGGRMTRELSILDGGSASLPASAAAALRAAPCVAAVTPDARVTAASIGGYDPTQDTGSLYNTTQLIGAQAAWQQGYTGKGVNVALIDSGVAPVQGLNGFAQVINGPDLSFDSLSPALLYNDAFGHGTHMAGIIAGNDIYSLTGSNKPKSYVGNTKNFIGVAPDARIFNMKTGDMNGVADVSQVIASIDWVVQHRLELNIRVINLSYGTNSSQAYTLDPLAYAAEVAWRNNIVVVAAAGNRGNNTSSVDDPAYDPYLIAVGGADTQQSNATSDDTVATFSNSGDGLRNPDLVAPGAHIESLRDPGSHIDQAYGSSAAIGTRFFLGSGTSQATAVVSGAVALYLSAHGSATPDQVKNALVRSATPLLSQPYALQGAGELNVGAAVSRPMESATQSFTQSTGTGSLESSRGDMHVASAATGAVLTGEQDVMGHSWNSASIAQAEQSGSAWTGGGFNGSAWSGSGWSGSGWSGSAWSGSGWSGSGWSGSAWSGSAWSGSGWSGSGWSGSGWSGSGWSGSAWSGSGWSGSGWSGADWG